jgi:hypothetical protein
MCICMHVYVYVCVCVCVCGISVLTRQLDGVAAGLRSAQHQRTRLHHRHAQPARAAVLVRSVLPTYECLCFRFAVELSDTDGKSAVLVGPLPQRQRCRTASSLLAAVLFPTSRQARARACVCVCVCVCVWVGGWVGGWLFAFAMVGRVAWCGSVCF